MSKKSTVVWLGPTEGRELSVIKSGLRSVRDLRATMLAIALRLQDEPDEVRARLITRGSSISAERLESEWSSFLKVVRADLASRMEIEISSDGASTAVTGPRLPRRDRFADILLVLVNRWLLRQDAITRRDLGTLAGASYPTIATALNRLAPHLEQRSDRAVALTQFPTMEWQRLRSSHLRAESAVRLADRSGQPRSPASLLERLRRTAPPGVALGGVPGATFWDPAIDARGIPRIDLWVHCPNGEMPLDLVAGLDAALQPIDDPAAHATVVIHPVQRPVFMVDDRQMTQPIPVADPAQCLLDLQDLRLDAQADQFIDRLREPEDVRTER